MAKYLAGEPGKLIFIECDPALTEMRPFEVDVWEVTAPVDLEDIALFDRQIQKLRAGLDEALRLQQRMLSMITAKARKVPGVSSSAPLNIDAALPVKKP